MTQTTSYPSRLDHEPPVVERAEPVLWNGLGAPGPFDEATLAVFDRRGFVVCQLFDDGEIVELEREVERIAAEGARDDDPRVIMELDEHDVRSVFGVHLSSKIFARLAADERLVGAARQILGSDVYIHQSRVNRKPGLRGREFAWHSDFETWHHEDGMPAMRAVSVSVALTPNLHHNGSVMLVPGSHRRFIGCIGATPEAHHRQSLRQQQIGVPSDEAITALIGELGLDTAVGPAGSVLFFDCNTMHGSNGNITPFSRTNVFFVYNSVENRLEDPISAPRPRPEHIAARDRRVVGS